MSKTEQNKKNDMPEKVKPSEEQKSSKSKIALDATHYNIPGQHKTSASQWQLTKRKIHAVRRRLQQNISAQFEGEFLILFAKNELGTALYIPIFAMIIGLYLLNWINPHIITIWLSLFFLSRGITLLQARYFLKSFDKNNTEHLPKWEKRFILGQLLEGLCWSSIVFICLIYRESLPLDFIFWFALSFIALKMTFTTAKTAMVAAATLPINLTAIFDLVLIGDNIHYLLAVIIIGMHIYFFLSLKSLGQAISSMLEYRYEKDALVSELEQAKLNSDEARVKAEEANSAKSRFLATMSHELRTPLNAIIGFSEIMAQESFGKHKNPQYKEYSDNILSSGQHLLKLINEILDLSRIEAERYELAESCIKLYDVADDCVHLLSIRAKQKNIKIDVDSNLRLRYIWVDERAMRQIILNLLSNAIKFAPQGGHVKITVDRNRDNTQFLSIEDNGPGIPKEEITKVLTPFGQGALAHETSEAGTGLGLPIVQKLLHLHGSELNLQSELRKGTKASFVIPKERIIHAVPAIIDRDADGIYKYALSEMEKQSEEFSLVTEQIKEIMLDRQKGKQDDDAQIDQDSIKETSPKDTSSKDLDETAVKNNNAA